VNADKARAGNVRPCALLLVEDNPGDVELFRESLSPLLQAENVAVAASGTEALAHLERSLTDPATSSPDLIVLDLNLPGLDGRTVLTRLREDPRWRNIPVVVLSSSEAEADVSASYNNGANCYVAKPLGLAEFRAAVRSIEQFWLEQAILPTRLRPTGAPAEATPSSPASSPEPDGG
jgi:CheY-like chemotaxis protein